MRLSKGTSLNNCIYRLRCVARADSFRTIIAVIATVATAHMTVGCGNDDSAYSSPVRPSATTDIRSPTTNVTTSTATVTPSAPVSISSLHGILIGQFDGKSFSYARYGVVDPRTGGLTMVRSFQTTSADLILTRGHELEVLSPDWNRIAAVENVGTEVHAGWVDQSGVFFDVTSKVVGNTPQPGDFDKPLHHESIGFDSAGNFYFEDRTEKSRGSASYRTMRVSAADPVVATQMGVEGSWLNQFYFDSRQNLVPFAEGVYACQSTRNPNSFIWIDNDRYITASHSGESLLVWDRRTILCPLETGGYRYVEKLKPGDGEYELATPVVNSAGDAVAFVSTTRNFSGVYTMPLKGGPAQRTEITSTELQGYMLIGWI